MSLGTINVNTKNHTVIFNGNLVKRNYYKVYDNSYTKIQIRSVTDSSNNKLLVTTFEENPITEFHIINKNTLEDVTEFFPTPEENAVHTLPDGNYEVIIKGNFGVGYVNQMTYPATFEGSTVFIDEVHLQPKLTTGFGMFANCIGITDLKSNLWDLSEMKNINYMFSNCSNMEHIDTSNWNLSKVTQAMYTFDNCSSLQSIDVKNWDLSNANNINGIFSKCSSLKSIDLSNWKVNNPNFAHMFDNCSLLEQVFLNNDNFLNVDSIAGMFKNCVLLKSIDLSSFKNIKDLRNTFENCTSLKHLNVSNFNTSECCCFSRMFKNCSSLTELDLSHLTNDNSNTGEHDEMFSGCTLLEKLDISNFNVTNTNVNINTMFLGCDSLTKMGFLVIDNQKVPIPETVTEIFNINYGTNSNYFGTVLSGNTHIKKITGGTIHHVTMVDMDEILERDLDLAASVGAFSKMTNLEEFSNVTMGPTSSESLTATFYKCTNLKKIKLSSLKWIRRFNYTFLDCSSLQEVDISGIEFNDTIRNSWRCAFRNCTSLQKLITGSLNLNNITVLNRTFMNCSSLTHLDLSKCAFSVLTDIKETFLNCSSLEFLNITSFKTNSLTKYDSFLKGVPQTCIILVSPNFNLTEQQCGWNGNFIVVN